MMNPFIRQHRLKLSLPLLLTLFLLAWTFAVYPFSAYGVDWTWRPLLAVLPAALVIHIYLIFALPPKWPLVGYAAVNLALICAITVPALMFLSHDSL